MALIWALDGIVLPHRVLPQERERSCLRLDPDLTVLAPLVSSGALRSPAGDLRMVADGIHDPALDASKAVPDRFLALPYGVARWLTPGTMVGVTVRGGSLELLRLDDPEPASAQTTAVLEGVAADLLSRPLRPYPHGPVAVDDLLLEAAAIAPGLLRGLTEPIGDTLRRCGLTTRRDLLGTPLTHWGVARPWRGRLAPRFPPGLGGRRSERPSGCDHLVLVRRHLDGDGGGLMMLTNLAICATMATWRP